VIRTNPGIRTGSFNNRDFAWSLAYGHRYNDELRFGVSGKFISQKLHTSTASDVAFDLGIHFSADRFFPGLTLGLSLLNIGTSVQFLDETAEGDPLPLTLKVGAAYRFYYNKILLTGELDKLRDDDVRGHFGGEFQVHPSFALRLGYEFGHDFEENFGGLKGGAGFKIRDFNVDYAFERFGGFGLVHRISSGFKFGAPDQPFALLDKFRNIRMPVWGKRGEPEKPVEKRISRNKLPHKIWGECIRCPFFPDCGEVPLAREI